MKIAITAQGQTLDDPMDPRFGRAPGFVIYDTETKENHYIENIQNMQAAQGAGIQSGRSMADAGVQAVLTGHVGPKAFTTLQAAGIKIYSGVKGTVRDAVEQFTAGKLEATKGADVDGHWG
jgi:predicted Fe-Mo cluster-binding NifX family protein